MQSLMRNDLVKAVYQELIENSYLKSSEWGCLDLVSASSGETKKRYGCIYVDCDDTGKGTLERRRKKSFQWYKQIVASNGENL